MQEKPQYQMQYLSPIGELILASDGQSITGLWIKGQKYFGSTLRPDAIDEKIFVFDQTSEWLHLYFSGKKPNFMPPLKPQGSVFRQAVWRMLCAIPYGELTTYGEIARQLSQQGIAASAQAVGGAVGHNPISILIPCHRVVGALGSLTGYAGGIEKKIWLLRHEGVQVEKLTVPQTGTAL